MKINKKAHFFAVSFVLVMIVVIIAASISFGRDIKNSEKSLEILTKTQDAYVARDINSQFAKDSASLSAQQAFQGVASMGGTFGDCFPETINGVKYVVWNDKCNPNTEKIKADFPNDVRIIFDKYLLGYDAVYSFSLDKNILTATAKNKNQPISVSSENIIVSSTYDPSFLIDLNDLGIYLGDFESLYLSVKGCNKKVDCIKDLDLKRWKISDVSENAEAITMKISTEKSFFFIKNKKVQYSPIDMNIELKQ